MDQPTPAAPTPAAPPPPPTGAPSGPATEPFEMPPGLTPPEPMGGKPPPGQTGEVGKIPESDGEKKPIGSYLLMIGLVLILIFGVLIFAAWKGWISLFGFGGGKPTPSPELSAAVSPRISPEFTPGASPETSPQVTSNVNDETRKKDLANIKNGLKKYFNDKASYPVSSAAVKTSDQTSPLYQALVPTYIESLPNDPLAPSFYYGYKSDGQSFEITCVLEDKSDPSGSLMGGLNIYKVTNTSIE